MQTITQHGKTVHYFTVAVESPDKQSRASLVEILKKLIDAGIEAAGDTPDDFGDEDTDEDLALIEELEIEVAN